jgi:hypothetical protein
MQRDYRSLLGIFLIAGGLLLGAQQFGLVSGDWSDAVFAGLWALGALFFFDLYRRDRNQWWFGLVAFILAGLAVSGLISLFFPAVGDAIGGAIFFGAMATGFILVYRRDSNNWWALIPAGVMLSLAAITVVDDLPIQLPFDEGGLLFLGMGLTFLVLTQIKVAGERLAWAIFPAIALLLFGVFVAFGRSASWNIVWPSLIIIFGLYFLVDAMRKRS